MLDFIVYQVYSGIFLLTILVLGSFIIQDTYQNEKSKSSLFARKIFWGTLFSIALIALILTKGNSVFLGLFIPLSFIILSKNKTSFLSNPLVGFSLKPIISKGLAIWGLSVCFSFLEFIKYYNFQYGLVTDVPHFDFLYYGKLSEYMVEYGVENRLFLLNQLIENATGLRQPYHYPELWINGVLVKLSGASSVQLLLFSTFPLLKAITCSSIFLLSIGESKQPFRFATILIGISILTISGFYFPFYRSYELLNYFDGITQTGFFMTFGKKYVLIYFIAAISIFYYYHREKFVEFLLLLSIIPLFSIGCLPSVCAIEILFPLYLIYTKKFEWRHLFRIYLNTFLVFIFIGIYYSLNGLSELNSTLSDSVLISRIIKNPSLALFKTFFFSVFFSGVRFALFFLPYFAILIYLKFNNLKSLLNSSFLLLSVVLGGLMAVGLSVGILDNGQFFYNSIPILILLIAYEISKALYESKLSSLVKISIPSMLLIFGFWHSYVNFEHEKKSNIPYNQIDASVKIQNLNMISESNQGQIIGLFKTAGLEKTSYNFLDSYYRYSHFYLQLLPNYKDAINIDIADFTRPNIKLNSVDQYLIKQNELYYYLNKSNQVLSGASLTSFARKINASFFADGDSLFIINNISDQELETLFNKHIRQ